MPARRAAHLAFLDARGTRIVGRPNFVSPKGHAHLDLKWRMAAGGEIGLHGMAVQSSDDRFFAVPYGADPHDDAKRLVRFRRRIPGIQAVGKRNRKAAEDQAASVTVTN